MNRALDEDVVAVRVFDSAHAQRQTQRIATRDASCVGMMMGLEEEEYGMDETTGGKDEKKSLSTMLEKMEEGKG
jgi:hypothetical protein